MSSMTTQTRDEAGWWRRPLAAVIRLSGIIGHRYALVHPVQRLRWLRNSMLAMILVAAALCLLVTYRAHDEITNATDHGAQAISYVNVAYLALIEAQDSIITDFGNTGGALGDFATTSEDYTAAANQDLGLAAENDVAGGQGVSDLQAAQGLIANYNDLVQQLGVDAGESSTGKSSTGKSSSPLAMADLWDLVGGVQNILSELNGTPSQPGLDQAEQARVLADLRSGWLNPGDFWWLLLAPFFVMLLLAVGSGYVMWRGFRRVLSVRLAATLAVTLGLIALVAVLNMHDSGHAEAVINHPPASQVNNSTFTNALRQNRKILKSLTAQAKESCGQCASAIAKPLYTLVKDEQNIPNGDAEFLDPSTSYSADTGFAYSPWALAAGLVLGIGAIILAYTAYRPRLEEYRYRL